MDVGQHSRIVNNESVYDVIRREWANSFKTITSKFVQASTNSGNETGKESTLQMGWALSRPKTGSVRFPENVRRYLTAKFDIGERTGHKADPTQVSLDLRAAKDENGERLFKKEEWLNKLQIKGFFSRLAKQRRKGLIRDDTPREDATDESDFEENEEKETLLGEIIYQIDVSHPIHYDTYDLCEMYNQMKLSVFKVSMLKEICGHFELQFRSKDKKQVLIDVIATMVKQCTCNKSKWNGRKTFRLAVSSAFAFEHFAQTDIWSVILLLVEDILIPCTFTELFCLSSCCWWKIACLEHFTELFYVSVKLLMLQQECTLIFALKFILEWNVHFINLTDFMVLILDVHMHNVWVYSYTQSMI